MTEDKEYEAMGAVIKAVEGLHDEQRARIFEYVLKRFSIPQTLPTPSKVIPSDASSTVESSSEQKSGERPLDIRELRNVKKPKSDTQMAVLVAYYLKTTTTEAQKDAITSEDIVSYFTQAGYPLPIGKNGAADTLNNAKKSGYFESAGKGLYRLNPVGFNLAAYNMPTENSSGQKRAAPQKTPRKSK